MAEGTLAQPGDVIARRYRVESWLGQGNMAIVYQAKHTNTGRACALKLVHPHLVTRKEFVDLFVKEAQLGARIGQNPHIVDVFDAGVDEVRKVPYLAMELLQGETLESYLKRHGRVPPRMARIVFEHLADALDQAHGAGVIHRDLKPGNLFLARDRKGQMMLKVMDFGIAKVLERQSQRTATQIGSPAYAAPEQLGATLRSLAASQGIAISQGVGPSTDVWALGLVAYEMLTGVPPGQYWGVDTYADLMICIALEEHQAASQRAGEFSRYLPAGFDGWFARCIQRDAKDRWQSAGEAVRELAHLIDGSISTGGELDLSLPDPSPRPPPSLAMPMSEKKGAKGPGPLRPAITGVPLKLQVAKAAAGAPAAPAPSPVTTPVPAPRRVPATPVPQFAAAPAPVPSTAPTPVPAPAAFTTAPSPGVHPAAKPQPPAAPPAKPPALVKRDPPPAQKPAGPPMPPKERVRLQELASQLEKEGKWSELCDVLRRLADAEPGPERKSRYLYQLAVITVDQLDQPDRALELLDEALDKNPVYGEAFEQVIAIHEGRADWKRLERAHRKMLHRLSGTEDAEFKHRLWRKLAEIYRDLLNNPGAALESFRMAARFAPEKASDQLALAELCASIGQVEDAVAAYQDALRADPSQIDAYRQIYRLSMDRGAYDAAWCAAATLAFLREADDEQARYHDDYRPDGRIQVKNRLDNELWVHRVFHEDESLLVGKVFEMIARAAFKAKTEAMRAKRELPVLDPFLRHDPTTSSVPFVRTMGWAARVLGVQCPALFVRSDVPGGVAWVPSEPAASVVGQSLLTGFSPEELAFVAGKHLAMYRGEHFIKLLFPSAAELQVLFFAAVKIAVPDASAPRDIEQRAETTAKVLRGFMGPQQLDGLKTVVRRFLSEREEPDIARHARAIELTAVRAGFILTGDLAVAKKIIAVEAANEGEIPAADKLKDLLAYSVSESYFALRESLGIAIGQTE